MKKVIVLNDTRSENHHGCSRVMNVIDLQLRKYGFEDVEYVPLGQDWSKSENLKLIIIQSDILIINGEGTIHDDSLLGLALIQSAKFAYFHNVKCFLINATFQNNKKIAYEDMKYFSLVSVRESNSHEELLKIKIHSEITPDLTFYFDNLLLKKGVEGDKYYTDNVCKEKTRILHKFGKDNKLIYSNIFNNNFVPPIDITKRLLMIFKNNSLFDLLAKIWVKFVKKNDNIIESVNTYDHISYADHISNSSYILCGRFHTVCYALNSLTPFQAISSNTFKIEGLLNDIGLPLNKFMLSENRPEQINVNIGFSHDEVQSIMSFKKESKKKIDSLFGRILNE